MRIIIALVFTLAFAAPTTGCAAVLAALPVIVSAATSVGQVIDAIESFVNSHNESTPAIGQAIIRARAAVVAVLHAANGAQDINDESLQAALTEFQAAYQAVIDLTQPLGVRASPIRGRLMAVGPNQLDVPDALQLRRELGGQ